MAAELSANPDLRVAARNEFDALRGADYQYHSLFGDRDPSLDYRKPAKARLSWRFAKMSQDSTMARLNVKLFAWRRFVRYEAT